MVITRLECLEAGQNRIEAAILGMQQQSQTFNQKTSSGRRSLRPFCRRFRSAGVKGTRRLLRRICDWHWDQRNRVDAYFLLLAAKIYRGLGEEVGNPKAAEDRRNADWCEEMARRALKSLKNGTKV